MNTLNWVLAGTIIFSVVLPIIVLGAYCFRTAMIKRLDKCEVCKGERGGIRGNENVVNNQIMCDYCHSDYMAENVQN
jgi:hypothetical protein